MKIAYLTNRYPWPSHTFIRREIAALEGAGVSVMRFSIRATDPRRDVVDPADVEECRRTRAILSEGAAGLVWAALRTAGCRPLAFLAALRIALSMSRRSDRGVLRHLAYLAEACVLCTWLRHGEADHLHAHFATNSADVALLCRLVGGPPYSFTIHGPEPFDRPTLLSLERKVAHASFVAAITDFARSQLCRWCAREHWTKIHIVRCGVDDSFLDAPAEDQMKHVRSRLVCIARLSEQKGLFVLVEAARLLAQKGADFELHILGDGPLRSEIEDAVRAAGLDGSVRLHGWVPAQDVRRHVLESRALVLPSFAEGLPIVLMEAMALRRPVIATSVGGISELVLPGVHGWLLPPGNAHALARAMHEAICAPVSELIAMGRAGAAAIREKHDCAKEASRLALLFSGAWRASESHLSQRDTGDVPVVDADERDTLDLPCTRRAYSSST